MCLTVALLASAAGYLLSLFSYPVRPADDVIVPTVGILHRVVPPAGVQRLREVHSFTVTIVYADDYGRAYVNNYLVGSREDRNDVFHVRGRAQDSVSFVMERTHDRDNYPIAKDWDVRRHLIKGKNFIVLEAENSTLSGCLAKFEIKINGTHVYGSPLDIPEGFEVEGAVFNARLRGSLNRLHIPVIENALCARRVIELELR
jgi:hypothetical protein